MIENKLPTRGYSYQSSTVKLYVIPISTVDKTSCTFVSRKLTKREIVIGKKRCYHDR